MTTRPGGERRLDPDELAALEEQHQFLRRSLDDLARERAAGDLDESDYETLWADYTRRAEAVERAIAEGKARFAAARRRRSRPRSMAVAAAVVVVAMLAGVFAARGMGRREGGDTITGGFGAGGNGGDRSTPAASMNRCLDLEQRGEALLALKCYDDILADQPRNAEALAYRGWLVARAGLPYDALAYLDRAVKADGNFLDGRAFRAIVLARLCRPDEARAELDALAALNPPEQVQGLLEGVRADVDAQLSGARKCEPPAKTPG